MKAINLIPAARIEARRRRAQWVRCFAACGVYGVLVMAACALCRLPYAKNDPTVKEKLVEADVEVDRAGKTIVLVREQLALAEATLRASRSISEQPDWSGLMALLAAKAGDEIVLKTCLVRPKDPDRGVDYRALGPAAEGAARAAPPAPAEPSMALGLSGLGLSQAAVSQFVLNLERTGLFARVALIDTSRAALDRTDAIAFRIECSLDEPADGGPVPPPINTYGWLKPPGSSLTTALDTGEVKGVSNPTPTLHGGLKR